LLPRARFYSPGFSLSRAGDKMPMFSRSCSSGQHRRIISTSLSGLVTLLPTCFQLLLICTRQDHFTVWKFNFTEFQAGCQGFGAFNFCPVPRRFLTEVAPRLLSVRRVRLTGLPCYWQRAVLYTTDNPCQGIHGPIFNIASSLSDIFPNLAWNFPHSLSVFPFITMSFLNRLNEPIIGIFGARIIIGGL